jgi:hypothetical protein
VKPDPAIVVEKMPRHVPFIEPRQGASVRSLALHRDWAGSATSLMICTMVRIPISVAGRGHKERPGEKAGALSFILVRSI